MPPSTGRLQAEAKAEAIARAAPAERYERVVRLAQAIFGAPMAALDLVSDSSQFTVASVGFSVGFPQGETPVKDSLCKLTIQQDQILEVRDLREDERFAAMSTVTGPPGVRFFAGIPVRGEGGQNVGVLCIEDLTPRTLGRQEREMFADLGTLLEHEFSVHQEMDLAGRAQQLMLPKSAPDIAGVEVAGCLQPAREAGGDYFDWFVVNDGAGWRLQVVLGDVMGKGLAASLIACELRAVLRGHSRYTDVGVAVKRAVMTTGHDLEANDRFSTLWTGRLDPVTGEIEYIDAGHGLAFIASRRGCRRLTQDYLPIGMPVEDSWDMASDVLAEDELLVVVSDGVFDMLDDSFEEVEARLSAVLDAGLSCQQIVDRIATLAVSRTATDDVTALALRRVTRAGADATSPVPDSATS